MTQISHAITVALPRSKRSNRRISRTHNISCVHACRTRKRHIERTRRAHRERACWLPIGPQERRVLSLSCKALCEPLVLYDGVCMQSMGMLHSRPYCVARAARVRARGHVHACERRCPRAPTTNVSASGQRRLLRFRPSRACAAPSASPPPPREVGGYTDGMACGRLQGLPVRGPPHQPCGVTTSGFCRAAWWGNSRRAPAMIAGGPRAPRPECLVDDEC